MKNGKPFLKAENPKYPDLIPSEELMIQGVFRALIRRRKNERKDSINQPMIRYSAALQFNAHES